jgi:acyl dehydratase
MIERHWIGHQWPPHSAAVEAGRLRLFAKATGETDPVFSDEAAARAAGHPGLPAPPTFTFCLDMDVPDPFAYLAQMGVPVHNVLHGEQHFSYHAPVHAGDTLTYRSRIADIYDKKGGALEFIVKETRVENQHAALVAELRAVVVVRNVSAGQS